MDRLKREQLMSLFRELVTETNDVLIEDGVDEDTIWALARRLHDAWHRVMARIEDQDAETPRTDERRHSVLEELIRLVADEEDV